MKNVELSETLLRWNAQAVDDATALLKRAQAIGVEVAGLGDNMWYIVIEGAERKRLLDQCRVLRGDVAALDDEIIHYWRTVVSGH